jgi:hypothetical protein
VWDRTSTFTSHACSSPSPTSKRGARTSKGRTHTTLSRRPYVAPHSPRLIYVSSRVTLYAHAVSWQRYCRLSPPRAHQPEHEGFSSVAGHIVARRWGLRPPVRSTQHKHVVPIAVGDAYSPRPLPVAIWLWIFVSQRPPAARHEAGRHGDPPQRFTQPQPHAHAPRTHTRLRLAAPSAPVTQPARRIFSQRRA